MPWRLAGKPAAPRGMVRGEVCGEAEPSPRGPLGTSLPGPSWWSNKGSTGSGVTALTVCRKALRRALAEALSTGRGDGTSESEGRVGGRVGRSGRGGGTVVLCGLLPRE